MRRWHSTRGCHLSSGGQHEQHHRDNGSIDFQFNAGNGETQAATVTLSNFTGGTLGSATNTGAVTGGPLPAAITIGTTTAFNHVFETFKYGSSLRFTLDFSGPAVTAPTGLSTGNSGFFFSMFSHANGFDPALTSDPNGVAATVTVKPNGSITTAAVSPQTNFVPEPASVHKRLLHPKNVQGR